MYKIKKRKKTEVELLFPFFYTRREKIDETEMNLLFASFALNVKKESPKM